MKIKSAFICSLGIVLLFCNSFAYAGDGDLDVTFGTGGIVITDINSGFNRAYDMAVQSDDKIVAVGFSNNGTNNDFAVVRYNTDGSLDSTFGVGGIVATDIGSLNDLAYAVAIQSDGKILVTGNAHNGTDLDFAVVRYNTNGSLDSTFGTGGITTLDINSDTDWADAIDIQSDGKIIVAGHASDGTYKNFAVVRYSADGSLDNTFGTDGVVITDVSPSDNSDANDIDIQSDGKVVAAGYFTGAGFSNFTVVRYNTDGSLDSTFGTGGIVTTAIDTDHDISNGMALQSDGKIVLAGRSNNGTDDDFAVVRYNTDGSLDSTFGTGGIVTTTIGTGDDKATDVVMQSDGKIIAAGYLDTASAGFDFAVVRYNSDGSLDSTFGTDGKVITSVGPNSDLAYAIALQSDEKIVVAGESHNGTNPDNAIVRYLNGETKTQREILIELYNNTNGDNWTNNSGWKEPPLAPDGFSAAGECNADNPWYGITCDGTDNITEIVLQNNNLVGTIPTSIGDISNLQRLNLSYNQLTGNIPAQLGNLENLQWLYLNVNELTGPIPTEIGNLSNLLYLYLNSNQLTGSIPTQLGNLANLQYLDLYINQLTGSIPAELGNLENLMYLHLMTNQLTGSIPTELGTLTKLRSLQLYKNQLTGSIPTELGNLVDLQQLNLHNNQLTGSIPAELGNLTNLWSLTLYTNQLTGPIPAELGNLVNLQYLVLSGNQLTGSIPAELGNCVKLQNITLSGNQLTGSIPTELGNLVNLQALQLLNNQLSGSIPTEIGNLVNLQHLNLLSNQLTGSIPAELGNCVKLQNISLVNNQLSGSIPPELGNLTDLQQLQIRFNQLTGSIPPELGNLINLNYLYLDNNQMTGSIPPELGNLTHLTYLWLNDNQLTGTIPAELGNMSSLQALKLNNNQLTGPIPTELTNLTTLSDNQSDFRYNSLYTDDDTLRAFLNTKQIGGDWESSQTPPSQRSVLIDLYNNTNGDGWTNNTNWKTIEPLEADGFSQAGTECTWYGITCDASDNVTAINLSINNLIGTIPSTLSSLSNIVSLELYSNQLTGSIPPELGNLANLTVLHLDSNQLTGNIPSELSNLTNLIRLYLGTNQLSGVIPPELGNLASLTTLRLWGNELSGSIPPELGNLSNLIELQLSSNQLTDTIPPELGNLSNLIELQLGSNQLSGNIPSELGSLSILEYLRLQYNQLTDTIPPELGNLSNLIELSLLANQLTGNIPSELSNLTNLIYLYLDTNQLSGTIPPELGNLLNLTELYLDNNQLSGSIPPELGNLINIEYLYINSNRLTGPIPVELTNLTSLTNNFNDFRWNALYTSNAGLQTFLNTKQSGGDWESTQTIAPTNIAASNPTEDSVTLTWTAIPYTADSGGYGVGYSITPGGPYTLFEDTVDKTVTSSTVTGLSPGTDYYFALETFTNSHFNNQNTVYSEHSAEVSATTAIPSGTHSPDIPTAVGPINEAIVPSGDVNLQSSTFNDPDPLDTHASTYWQIKYAGNVYGREDYPASFNFLATSIGLTTHTVTGLVDGMKYEWRALYTDSSGKYSLSDDSAFKIGTTEAASVPQVYPGTVMNDYKIMTLPYWFDNPAAASIIGAPYDTSEFRIGYYDCEAGAGTYLEADHPEAIASPGEGFWVLARNGLDITAGGIPVTTEMDLEVPLYYNADYGNGWNQIGPPNAKNYYWNDVEIIQYDPDDGSVLYGPAPISSLADPNPFIDLRIWRWNNGVYESFMPGDLFLLEKYEGYWVKAKQSNLYLVFKVSAQHGSVDTKNTVTLAQLVKKGKQWLKNWVFASPQAYAGPDDAPPMPMGGLTNSQAGSSGGCFITTTAFGLP